MHFDIPVLWHILPLCRIGPTEDPNVLHFPLEDRCAPSPLRSTAKDRSTATKPLAPWHALIDWLVWPLKRQQSPRRKQSMLIYKSWFECESTSCQQYSTPDPKTSFLCGQSNPSPGSQQRCEVSNFLEDDGMCCLVILQTFVEWVNSFNVMTFSSHPALVSTPCLCLSATEQTCTLLSLACKVQINFKHIYAYFGCNFSRPNINQSEKSSSSTSLEICGNVRHLQPVGSVEQSAPLRAGCSKCDHSLIPLAHHLFLKFDGIVSISLVSLSWFRKIHGMCMCVRVNVWKEKRKQEEAVSHSFLGIQPIIHICMTQAAWLPQSQSNLHL